MMNGPCPLVSFDVYKLLSNERHYFNISSFVIDLLLFIFSWLILKIFGIFPAFVVSSDPRPQNSAICSLLYCLFVLFFLALQSFSRNYSSIFWSSSVLSTLTLTFSNSSAWLALSCFLFLPSNVTLSFSFIISHRRAGETEGLFAYSPFCSLNLIFHCGDIIIFR